MVERTSLNHLKAREMEVQAGNSVMALSTSLVALGIIFGEDRLIGYAFIGAGVVLAIAWSLMARWRRRATIRTDKAVRDE
jgi:hypothetical protein